MKYNKDEEKEKLEIVNKELIKFMRDYPKNKLTVYNWSVIYEKY